jgi:fatty-acyl-CoA synthase
MQHAEVNHPDVEIVTMRVEGDKHRYTYKDCALRCKKVAQALTKFGINQGDRVATLAWNTYRHMELWYGISGMGAVTHTVNPRLFADQLTYIMNHAEDRILFLDKSFVPLIEPLVDQLPTIEAYIIMIDKDQMPETSLPNAICYEDFIDAEDGNYAWPEFDENMASSLCYTSGTTGNPKGVLYSHRTTTLHTFCIMTVDTIGLEARDSFLPVVPMFHANAWGIPYGAAACGSKLVFNGPLFDGENMYNLLVDEEVTRTAAVPTIWLMLLQHLQTNNLKLEKLESVTIGGSACPKSMIKAFQEDYGVRVVHAWGMTETSPLGTVGSKNRWATTLSDEEWLSVQCKQGRIPFGVELKITDDEGNRLPHDGIKFGNLKVKGGWIVKKYFKEEGGDILDSEGYFDTGDVATIDEHGYMQITDRSKDVVKSGGEWISSIELENEAVGHPDIAEAAVIGVYHPKWDERPLLICIKHEGKEVSKDDMLAFLDGKVAKWWMPDDVVFVDEIPHSGTGKILKRELRETFKDYKLPTA